MLRAAAIVTLATAFGAALFAQSRDRGFGRSTSDWCGDQGDRDRAVRCDVREDTMGGANPVEIDAGRNGGIRMTMPDHYSAALETATTHGRISIDFPITVQGRIGRQITTTLGSGGARVRAVTYNGGVSIRRQ